MKKIAVVYWSGTGNTEAMAFAVAEGVKNAKSEAVVITAENFDSSKLGDYDGIAFGCPSMGTEELEPGVFEPMYQNCRPALSGKKIALFGSYGWGDGEWMETWESDAKEAGADLVTDPVICCNEPDDDAVEECRQLGAALAEA